MADLEYPMVVWAVSEEDGGGYVAFAPDLSGCMGSGDAPEAALLDLRNAILEWIDEAMRLGKSVPNPGSRAQEAHAERTEIRELIDAQDRLIKTQEELIKDYRDKIAQIKRVSVSFEHYQHFERPSGFLGVCEVMEVAPTLIRRKRAESMSH